MKSTETMSKIVKEAKEFLAENKDEIIMLRVKNEHIRPGHKLSLTKAMQKMCADDDDDKMIFNDKSKMLTVTEAKGHIIVLYDGPIPIDPKTTIKSNYLEYAMMRGKFRDSDADLKHTDEIPKYIDEKLE